MKVAKTDVPMIVATFVDSHIIPKASGWHKIAFGAASFAFANRVSTLIDDPSIVQTMTMLGVLDEDHNVDMDYFREMALASINVTSGKTPPVMGYVFDTTDIESFYTVAKQFAI